MNGIISAAQRQMVLITLRQQLDQQAEALVAQIEQGVDMTQIEAKVQTWSQEVGR